MVVTDWWTVGDQLKVDYEKKFLMHQGWVSDDWLDSIVPRVDGSEEGRFFGTKILNIFIASKPYGWVSTMVPGEMHFEWGFPGTPYSLRVDEFTARWLAYRDRFPSSLNLIFGDMTVMNSVQADCPTSGARDMMAQTALRLQQYCSTTPGFQYGGTFESPVPAAHFQPWIDEFYGAPGYQR